MTKRGPGQEQGAHLAQMLYGSLSSTTIPSSTHIDTYTCFTHTPSPHTALPLCLLPVLLSLLLPLHLLLLLNTNPPTPPPTTATAPVTAACEPSWRQVVPSLCCSACPGGWHLRCPSSSSSLLLPQPCTAAAHARWRLHSQLPCSAWRVSPTRPSKTCAQSGALQVCGVFVLVCGFVCSVCGLCEEGTGERGRGRGRLLQMCMVPLLTFPNHNTHSHMHIRIQLHA